MHDLVEYWRDESLGGIDLLRADFRKHVFVPHAHSEYVLCIYESGAQTFCANGERHVASRGSTVLIPPGTEHDGRSLDTSGFVYRAFYLSESVLDEITEGALKADRTRVWTSASPDLFNRVMLAHRTFEAGAPAVEKEFALASALQRPCPLAAASGTTSKLDLPNAPWKLRAAREYLETHYTDQALSVRAMAKEVSWSAAHLMRQFRLTYGLHIHSYVTQLRLEHARVLMLNGESPALAASTVGFGDQSHLIRRFRQFFGTSPGRYTRESVKRRQ